MTVGAMRLRSSYSAPCRPTIRSGSAASRAGRSSSVIGFIGSTPCAAPRRYSGGSRPGMAARTGRTPSASASSSASSDSVATRSAWPGTFDSPLTCWTFSGRAVSLLSSKPDSWQPSANAAGAASSRTMRTRTPGISSDLVHVLALFGPTGVGKTAVAIALAERLRERGEDPLAISADAIQVYRGLELLSGAATAEERERLDHRLLSFVDPRETFSAGQFAATAHEEIDAALAAGRRPIVVGGTGLYLQAALTDLELRPPPDRALRERIGAEMTERGPEALHAELARRAPKAAAAIDPRDRTRVGRALELLEMGEEPAPAGDESRLWTARLRHPTLLFGLTMERERLYERIDARVDEMVAAGAAGEGEAAPPAR